MEDLNGALLYASRVGPGTLVFDSIGDRKDTVAAFATRCSMSIPLFFWPEIVEGRRAFDGGLRNNFPLKTFLVDHPGTPFVALYLGKRDDRNKRFIGSELLDIIIEGEERDVVDAHRDDVVIIDTSPVGVVDFNLSPLEKQFLLKIGEASALRFLFNKKFDDGPDEATVEAAEKLAEKLRAEVCKRRKRRRWLPLCLAILIAVGIYLAILLIRTGIGTVWPVVHG